MATNYVICNTGASNYDTCRVGTTVTGVFNSPSGSVLGGCQATHLLNQDLSTIVMGAKNCIDIGGPGGNGGFSGIFNGYCNLIYGGYNNIFNGLAGSTQ